MKTKATVSAIFHSSLERAFKTPILGDVTKFLVGYGPVPAVVKITDDATWGKPGGTRIPHGAKNFASKGGPIGIDQVYVREENTYWEWGWQLSCSPAWVSRSFADRCPLLNRHRNKYGWSGPTPCIPTLYWPILFTGFSPRYSGVDK